MGEITAGLVLNAYFAPLGQFLSKGILIPAHHFSLASWKPQTLPLFGREDELEALRTAFSEVEQGNPRFMSLVGPPGSGKTYPVNRFLKELYRRAMVIRTLRVGRDPSRICVVNLSAKIQPSCLRAYPCRTISRKLLLTCSVWLRNPRLTNHPWRTCWSVHGCTCCST